MVFNSISGTKRVIKKILYPKKKKIMKEIQSIYIYIYIYTYQNYSKAM